MNISLSSMLLAPVKLAELFRIPMVNRPSKVRISMVRVTVGANDNFRVGNEL